MLKTKRQVLSDFRGGMTGEVSDKLLPLSYASVSYNFDCSDGTLRDGTGLKIARFNDNAVCSFPSSLFAVTGLYFFKKFDSAAGKYKDEILAYCSDKKIYSYSLNNSSPVCLNVSFSEKPCGIKYKYDDKDVFLLSGKTEGLYVYDGTTIKKIDDAPNIKDMCIHNERLFVTTEGEGTKLLFSEDFNPFNFSYSLTEGGYIDLQDYRGALQKIVSSMGYLYIFRSFGISRLSAFYDQKQFSVDHLFSSTGKIYPESVTPCADGIIFLAKEGLYKLTQSGVSKILSRYDAFLSPCDNDDAKGIYYNGKVYLKCKMFLDGKIENVIINYSITESKTYCTKGVDVTDLLALNGENLSMPLFVIKSRTAIYTVSEIGAVDLLPLKKVWTTPSTDFGLPCVNKTVKKIEAIIKGSVTVVIETENVKRKFEVMGNGKPVSINVCVKGNEFKFSFINQTVNCLIAKPVITYCYFD